MSGPLPKRAPDLPNLTAMRALDREEHIKRAMEAGMTRAQAEAHADEDLADRDDARP